MVNLDGRTGGAARSKRLLQCAIAVLALIPLFAGIFGVVRGPAFLDVPSPWPTDLDSHFRFLSGVFLMLGLIFYSTIPNIERKGERFRLGALMIVAGGLARLLSLGLHGVPSFGHVGGLVMELIVVPLLVLWQARVARAFETR